MMISGVFHAILAALALFRDWVKLLSNVKDIGDCEPERFHSVIVKVIFYHYKMSLED